MRQAALILGFMVTFTGALLCSHGIAADVESPDGNVVIHFEVSDGGRLHYGLTYRGMRVLADSRLGFVLQDMPALKGGFRILEQEISILDTSWKPVYGERSLIRDHYRQLTVHLEDGETPPRKMVLIFRAYDEGAAFCYSFPEQEALSGFTITKEYTEFKFTEDHFCYPVYSAQGVYARVPLSQVKPNCERPLTVELGDGMTAAVAEARLVDFARMRLAPAAPGSPVLGSMLAGPVTLTTPCVTPWRVVMLGDSPGQLLERNDLILNLNDPCAIEDTSWIKPGKVIREVTLTTEGGKRCVDFAVSRGIQYVEYDAGWYGHEYSDDSDATSVTRDPKKSGVQGDLDLHEVIHYGKERGIGILVYVNRRQLERQLDEILPLYREWGIKGVKYGFVQVGSQQWTAWLHEAVKKAADHRLMVDIHDEYRPTGFSRTYPNLMTQEGVHGNECMPSAENNLILPFTRFLCGAADCTICWYCDRIKTTRAHQLATAVVFYSPWQFVHWYDRPEQYQGEPELDFLKDVPVVWDETRVINGRIGNFITVARRKGVEWYLGSLNAVERRQLTVPLTFLDPGKKYKAWIYSDAGPGEEAASEVAIKTVSVDASTVLEADMAANGGQAVRIVESTIGPEKGSLVIVGGSMRDTGILMKFIELAGGKDAPFVVIPTASGAENIDAERAARFLTSAGATDVTMVHTYDPKKADTEEFVQPIQRAKGVWFGGGRQWRIVDAYANTRTEREIRKALERGGVIGGSSAGATIQGSYLVRGDTKGNTLMMGDHQKGFGYLKNSAIDQHLLSRNRQFDLIEVIEAHPELLGIGIDENTAIVVQGDVFEVIGETYVAVYDINLWGDDWRGDGKPVLPNGGKFILLKSGQKYNLKDRKVIPRRRRTR